MTSSKNIIKLFIVVILTAIISILLLYFDLIDIEKIIREKNDFHYNAISMSSIIGGFLFTGISILLSSIDKPRIKRLWENNYLDNLYRAAFIGMIANVLTIISALILLIFKDFEKLKTLFISIEIISIIYAIVFFMWCIKYLIFIIKRMKE